MPPLFFRVNSDAGYHNRLFLVGYWGFGLLFIIFLLEYQQMLLISGHLWRLLLKTLGMTTFSPLYIDLVSFDHVLSTNG